MERTNRIAQIANSIFNTICIIYDENELNFDDTGKIIASLNNALELTKNLHMKGFRMEIWSETSKLKRKDELTKLINSKFGRLLTWKPEQKTVPELNLELEKDLVRFFVKQNSINTIYSPLEKIQIEKLYYAIAHRLLKAMLDLEKVMELLLSMEAHESSIDHEAHKVSELKSNQLTLNPDKTVAFTSILNELVDQDFFTTANNTISISKPIIFSAFSKFLNSELNLLSATEIAQTNSVPLEPTILPSKNKHFPDYLLHSNKQKLAEEIRKEFSTDKGKSIRLLLHTLEYNNPPLITIGYRQAKDLYTSICDFFNRDIGTYQGIFDYKINDKLDKKDIELTSIRLKHILNSL